MLRVARGQSSAGNMICLAPGLTSLHVSKFSRGQSLGDPSDSENEGEGEEEAEAEEEAEDEGEDEESDSGNTPIKLQINLTTEVEREVDLFLESEEEQFTFEEFYCTLPPWARGRQKEVLAALKRLVNGYSVSPAKGS